MDEYEYVGFDFSENNKVIHINNYAFQSPDKK